MYTLYMHTNKINNKKYIGITKKKPSNRWANGANYKETSKFGKAIQKYGWDNFIHEILNTYEDYSEAQQAEEKYISKYKTRQEKYGYNMAYGGSTNRGSKFSNETKIKMSNAKKGNTYFKGKHQTLEVKKRLSKIVICVETNEEYIGLRDAQSKTGIHKDQIWKCCVGKGKTAGNYHWKYKDTE